MNANEVSRQKYAQLMQAIEELEARAEALERRTGDPAAQRELYDAQEALAAQRAELRRLSNGCGRS